MSTRVLFKIFMFTDLIKRDLAIAYKACAYLKLDDLTYTHLSAKGTDNTFFIYPFGLLFDEVTASRLIEVNFEGEVVSGQEMNYNPTGYALHSMIYEEKPGVGAIFHLHTPAIVAVSCQKKGLLPLSQWALHCYDNIGYHEYNSLALDKTTHKLKVLGDLKDNRVLMMRHHGAIVVGKTIEEAMFFSYHLEKACQTQCMMGHDSSECMTIPPKVCKKTHSDLMSFEEDLGKRDFRALKRVLAEKEFA